MLLQLLLAGGEYHIVPAVAAVEPRQSVPHPAQAAQAAQAAQPEFVLELELQTRLPLADDEVLGGLPLGGRVADHLQCGHMSLIHVFFMTFINCDA